MRTEQPLGDYARRAARTYGAAADHYGLAALSFWDRFGSATVARLRLAAGGAVLDLCCGAGASAIPAAHTVGTGGRVLGVDVAEPLLELALCRLCALRWFHHDWDGCTAIPHRRFLPGEHRRKYHHDAEGGRS